MDEKPAPPAPPGGEQRTAPPPTEEEEQDERYGPLRLQRLRKEDGRALIVYARAEEET
jgi:hypothetical protein